MMDSLPLKRTERVREKKETQGNQNNIPSQKLKCRAPESNKPGDGHKRMPKYSQIM